MHSSNPIPLPKASNLSRTDQFQHALDIHFGGQFTEFLNFTENFHEWVKNSTETEISFGSLLTMSTKLQGGIFDR